jgi:hypothetical protein
MQHERRKHPRTNLTTILVASLDPIDPREARIREHCRLVTNLINADHALDLARAELSEWIAAHGKEPE